MNKRGIAFNGRFLAAPPSGVQRVAIELIRNVDMLLGRAGPPDRNWMVVAPHGTRAMALSYMTRKSGGHFRGQLWEQAELPRMAEGQLLVHLCNQAPFLRYGDIVMIHDAQIFLTPHSYSPAFRAWYRLSLPIIAARAARILTVSRFSRDQLVANGVSQADKITVIPNGVDHMISGPADKRILARLNLDPGSYIIALSNTQAHKNIALLLEVFGHIPLPGIRLLLVGAQGRAEFAERGMSAPANVLFAGKVTDSELRALYEHALCMAFPSTTEGFGLPPLEAMSVGCPAVVAPCGAVPEMCADAALFAAPHDPQAWADAFALLAHDAAARAVFAKKGRARAAIFTWKRSASRLMDVILEVADGHTVSHSLKSEAIVGKPP